MVIIATNHEIETVWKNLGIVY